MMFLRILALALMLPLSAFAETIDDAMQSVNAAIDQAVRPGFNAYAQTTTALVPTIANLCDAPNPENLVQARAGFADVITAWSAVEFYRFGPTVVDNRLERTLFWPDPKGIGLKQVQALLAKQDQAATQPSRLAQKSVAVQGLAALEFILFGSDADDLAEGKAAFRCAYAASISNNLNSIAVEMASDWVRDDLPILNPGADNPAYRDADESLREIVQALSTGFEFIGRHKLRTMLGDAADKVRPRRTVFRRSQMTKAILAANLNGLKELLAASDFSTLLIARNSKTHAVDSAAFELGNAEQTIQDAAAPVAQAVTTEKGWADYNYLAVVSESLASTIGERLAADLGLILGFNSLDGD